MVEGSARERILTQLIEQGWIRLRRYPNRHWSVNTLADWASKFLVGFAGFREPDRPHAGDRDYSLGRKAYMRHRAAGGRPVGRGAATSCHDSCCSLEFLIPDLRGTVVR